MTWTDTSLVDAMDPLIVSVEPARPRMGRRPAARIASSWPSFGEDEIEAVTDVLRSGRINSLHHGDRCRAFEEAFARMCDMPFAISLANGTLALELALRALGIGVGDEVIVGSRSFIASASCVVTVGATPVFADVDPVSQNVSPASVAGLVTERTKGIIAVHLAGWPCEMDELAALARPRGIKIIEDCAQAHGATYKGRPIGSFGDAAAFSFCTDKIISTGGEGGMLLIRDRAAWSRAWSFKDHGKDPDAMARTTPGALFKWLHDSTGSNYRMTEMQAAIGLCQLAKLGDRLAARRRNAALLNDILSGLSDLRLTLPPAHVAHAYYKYYAFVRPEGLAAGWNRDRVVGEASQMGAPCSVGCCPEIYRERAFANGPFAPARRRRTARQLGECGLMMPVDHTLSTEAVETMGLVLRDVLLDAEAPRPPKDRPLIAASALA